jgi:hypothetical protein
MLTACRHESKYKEAAKPGSPSVAEIRLSPIDEILQLRLGKTPNQRVRVRGIVVSEQPEESILITDKTGGIVVRTSETSNLQLGFGIDVTAIPVAGEHAIELTEATIRRLPTGVLEPGDSGQFIAGAWDVPYQTEAAAVLQALEMADRCRRAFHASVRALRDWRRYNVPVTINNPQQVNIAAEGGRQVNVKE